MPGFDIPIKKMIVNRDDDVRLLSNADTPPAAYQDGDVTYANGKAFLLEGFGQWVKGSELVQLDAYGRRVKKQGPTAAVKQVATYLVTSTSASAGDVVRIVVEPIGRKYDVEYQQVPITKYFTINEAETSAAGIADALNDAIDADDDAPVTTSLSTATLTLTAKNYYEKFTVYSDDITGTFTVTQAPVAGIGTYEELKNIEWASNLDFDRNVQYMPEKGTTYNHYYFEATKSPTAKGDQEIPSGTGNSIVTRYHLWVKDGLDLETALDLLVGDVKSS